MGQSLSVPTVYSTGNVPGPHGMKLKGTPFQEITRNGKLVRFNMMYYPDNVCGCGTPGYSAQQFQSLLRTIQRERPDVDIGAVRYWFTELTHVHTHTDGCHGYRVCCCFWCFLCCAHQRLIHDVTHWNEKLTKWENDFNKEVLKPKGMFMKLQSVCAWGTVHNVEYGNSDVPEQFLAERWFAFAFTQEESEKLQREPHMKGFDNDGKWSKVDKSTPFACHPPEDFIRWVKRAPKPTKEEIRKNGGINHYAPCSRGIAPNAAALADGNWGGNNR